MGIQEIIKEVMIAYEFIGQSFDKEGKSLGYHYLYSKVIEIFPSQVGILRKELPNFNFTNLYLNYYIVGFNK